MSLSSINNKGARRFWITGGLIILLVGVQFVLWPWLGSQSQELHDKRAVTQQVAEVGKRNEETTEAMEKQAGYFKQLDEVVPLHSTLAQQVEKMEQLAAARRVGLVVSAINEGEDKKKSMTHEIVPVKITLQISGYLNDVLYYFHEIEHQQEIVTVTRWWLKPAVSPEALESISDTGESKAPISIPFSLNVDAVFYLRNQPGEPVASN